MSQKTLETVVAIIPLALIFFGLFFGLYIYFTTGDEKMMTIAGIIGAIGVGLLFLLIILGCFAEIFSRLFRKRSNKIISGSS